MSRRVVSVSKSGAARCPKFDGCNAPICPLDDWRRAQHLQGERICLWLREAVKPGGTARVARAATDEIAAAVAVALPEIMASGSADLRHKLTEASKCGSKLASMHAVRECKGQVVGGVPDSACCSAAARAASHSCGIEEDDGRP